MSRIVLIAAAAENNVIGMKGRLPWHIPADLKHFRQLTTGHPVIMGRKTWDEIYARLGGPLKNRTNIVLTKNSHDFPQEVMPVSSVDAAMAQAGKQKNIMVIGGAQIYKIFLPFAQRIYLTRVFAKPEGDVYFPELPPDEWQETEREDFNDDNLQYAFITLTRQR